MCYLQGQPIDCTLDTPVKSTEETSYMRKQCTEGYYGPLCAMCIREGPQPYGRTSTWTCQQCKNAAAIVLAFIGSNLLSLAFLYYSIHSTLKDNEDDVAVSGFGNKVKASELTRVRSYC